MTPNAPLGEVKVSNFYLFECIASKVIVVEADDAEEAAQIADEQFTDSSDWEATDMTAAGQITPEAAKSEIRHGAVNATESISRRGL